MAKYYIAYNNYTDTFRLYPGNYLVLSRTTDSRDSDVNHYTCIGRDGMVTNQHVEDIFDALLQNIGFVQYRTVIGSPAKIMHALMKINTIKDSEIEVRKQDVFITSLKEADAVIITTAHNQEVVSSYTIRDGAQRHITLETASIKLEFSVDELTKVSNIVNSTWNVDDGTSIRFAKYQDIFVDPKW